MDPFDDFEFKPLTEGLGFHKKSENQMSEQNKQDHHRSGLASSVPTARDLIHAPQRASVQDTSASFSLQSEFETNVMSRESTKGHPSKSISDLIASLPPSLDFLPEKSESRPQIFQPLARDEYKPSFISPTSNPVHTPRTGSTIGQVLPMPGSKAGLPNTVQNQSPISGVAAIPAPLAPPSAFRQRLDQSYTRAFPQTKTEKDGRTATSMAPGGLVLVPAHLGAGILDAMVVTGMGTLLLVSILLITKVNLLGLLANAETDLPTRYHLVLLFVAVLQLYLLSARSFFGASLGEWAFDLQLGDQTTQNRAIYPIQVAWRTCLLTFTGFIFLPLLSLLFRRDLASYVTGLKLYRRV